MKRAAIITLAVLAWCSQPTATNADDQYASSSLTAAQIFAKAEAASGSLAPGFYRRFSRLVGGGRDQTITTLISPEGSKTTVEGGGFSSAFGVYKHQHWTQDSNGVVNYETNFHANEDANAVAFEKPDDPSSNVRVLGITKTAPQLYVVEVDPASGEDEKIYYDASTFDVVKIEKYGRDGHHHITQYADYRSVLGERIAATVRYSDGRPQNDWLRTLLSFEHVPAADVSIPSGGGFMSYTGTKPIAVPASFTSHGIILHAKIGERGVDLLLDSGAPGFYIDPSIVRDLNLVVYGHSVHTVGGGDVEFSSVRIPRVALGDLVLSNVVFSTSPFSEEAGKSRIVGLVGYDFLANGVFSLDFSDGSLMFYPPGAFDPTILPVRGWPLQLDDGVPRTDVWIEQHHLHFLVDTGADRSVIYRDGVSKLSSASYVEKGAIHMTTIGGQMGARVVELKKFAFGGVEFQMIDAMEPAASTFDILSYDGILGRDVLEHYKVFFDYPNGAMYTRYTGY